MSTITTTAKLDYRYLNNKSKQDLIHLILYVLIPSYETRERKAFEAGRSQYSVKACPESDSEYYQMFEYRTYEDYLKEQE